MKVKVYAKGRKDKVTTIEVKNASDLKNLVMLAKSEVFRKGMLKDIDYEDYELVFKIDGEKVAVKDLIQMGMKKLNEDDDDSKKSNKKKKNKDKDSGKKKKRKKHDDDDYSDKKKKKKGKKGKKKDKVKSSKSYLDVEDGYVCVHRSDD